MICFGAQWSGTNRERASTLLGTATDER